MTIVVAVKKGNRVVMASDSMTSRGNERMPVENGTFQKIVRAGRTLIGGAGWTIYDTIMRDHLARSKPPRLANETDIYRFFVRFWRALRERYSYVNDQPVDEKRPFADLDSDFVVAGRKGIFEVGPDMAVVRCERYVAIGSGAHYALGALHALWDRIEDPEALAITACETAVCFDVHCGGKVVTMDA
jgi:ATP-dependent HslUV protease subunit HslV